VLILESREIKWTIDRRYNEFKALHELIKKEIGSTKDLKFPKFPPSNFLSKFKDDFLGQRKYLLDNYLKHAAKETPDLLLNFLDCFGTNVSYLFSENDSSLKLSVKELRKKKNETLEKMDVVRRILNDLDKL
jgi:hypothetical protein